MGKVVGMVPRAVRIGGMSRTEILSTLHGQGIHLNEIAKDLFAHPDFQTSGERSTIGIRDVSVGELGHANGATLRQVFDRAEDHGLSPCPLELAAHLRLQFTDQAEGFVGFPPSKNRAPPGSLTVAARPIVKDGMRMGFYLRRISGVLWLRGYRSPAEHVWDAGDRFVFCCPDKRLTTREHR